MKLHSAFVLFIFGVTASNATFHRKENFKHFFTLDMNGFHNHNHGFAFHQLNGQFGPPSPPSPMYGPHPPPVYGPPPPPVYGPPFPQFHHYPHHHHKHKPNCEHKHGDGMTNTNIMSNPSNPYNPYMNNMPFIPNMNNPIPSIINSIPFNPTVINPFNPNFPFNLQNIFNQNSNTFNDNIPSNTIEVNNNNNNVGYDSSHSLNNPTNLPADQLPISESTYDTNTLRPIDANTALYPDGQSTSTPSILNAGNHHQYSNEMAGPNEATTTQHATNNMNNNNKYSGKDESIATNNDIDISNNNQPTVPGVSDTTTTTTPSSTQGTFNGLDYDIDVRFGDSNNKTKTEQ